MGYPVKQSTTAQPLVFFMTDSSDHITGKTGLSPTVTLSKNGGSFASPSGAVSEIGSGWYKVAGNATDNGTLGPLILHATSSGADPTDVEFMVVAYDPQAAYSTLDAAGVRSATGLASANLDTQLSTIAGYIDTEVAAILAAVSNIANLASATINVNAPHLAQDYSFQIIRDDDYYSSESANFSATIGASPSLSGATLTLEIQDDVSEPFDNTNLVSTSASASGTTTQTITADIPRTVTDGLSEGWHAYRVKAVLSNGHVRTLVRGRVNILSWGDDAPN